MNDEAHPPAALPQSEEVAAMMAKIAEQVRRVAAEFVQRQGGDRKEDFSVLDPKLMMQAFSEAAPKMVENPAKILETQMRLWQDYLALCTSTGQRLLGQATSPVATPSEGDRRFKDDAWEHNPIFDFIKQSYLLTSRHILETTRDIEGLDEHTAQKLDFYTRQFLDAIAPTNFVLTNPQVLRQTRETSGMNLLQGLSNLLDDLERGKGKLRIKMTDEDRFSLGENVAVTPGKVVFQNDLMQLLQYEPSTKTVYRRPLLIIPPWINKYYILDLRPKNSFVKWAVDNGHTVFVISWVNPDGSLAEKSFDDYMLEGPMAALDAITRATGERNVKAIGYCLGGTLLAVWLAWMKARGDERVKAATFLTAMTDFSEPGELGVFIDEELLNLIDEQMEREGYFEGAAMAEAFNSLRANDLIWGFVVNNYLMGKEPFPFDLLYWNSDSTRMPKRMHSFYLRKMYLENRLVEPGGIEVAGEPIDLRVVDTPSYFLSTKDDHIAPWKSTYAATRIFQGRLRFVLGASGHIAGVINPPVAKKYGYWVNPQPEDDPEKWLGGADFHDGSWWLDGKKWVSKYKGKKVPARKPGDGKLEVIENAPGSYVSRRSG